MAHFAKLDESNVVIDVHVVNNSEVLDENGNESETKGIAFLVDLHHYPHWKQTSYNGTIRKNYAGIGYTFNEDINAFVPPKPFNSWTLNNDTAQWEAPTPMPGDGGLYAWNEDTLSWDATAPLSGNAD